MRRTFAPAVVFAVLVWLFAWLVYMRTLTPTVPFWDSGEFIAVAKILGVPHPPGTPFFVLLARVFGLIPWATYAQRINALSAVSASLCVLLTYLATLRMIRLAQGAERQPWQEWVAIAGASIAALMLAFSDNFWENSIEAEVYQMMSLAQILVFWLGLKWWEAHDRRPTISFLLVATYVMWLSVGLHLGVGIMGLPLIALVAMTDRPVAMLFAMPFLVLLRVTEGLEKMTGYTIVLSLITYAYYFAKQKLPGWLLLASIVGGLYGCYFAFSDANFNAFSATIAALAVIGPMAWMAPRHREGRVLLLAVLLMVAGYSTHLYLPIRAAQHPAVNEGAPDTWPKFRDLLERRQYGEMHLLPRRGKFVETQLDKEFWRYFRRQWPLFNVVRHPGRWPGIRLGADADHPIDPHPWAFSIPLLLGLAGGIWQARRERRSFVLTFTFLGLSTAGMIVFLNFSDHEVRDRDYFFQSGYHAWAMWIGMGAVWLVEWVRESFGGEGARRLATVGTTALLSAQPFLLLANLWWTHDRSGNYIARDYAYNMLVPLKPNSFMFTNGDNDTFPLWYLQEVEGIRKDVRIVNLSLLNTDWYIRQLRDEEPKVPISLDDRTIDLLGAGAIQDEKGNIMYTNEYMVRHIMEQAKAPNGGWVKQPYFAVTVPEHYGFDPYFSLQGLVDEVKRDSTQAGLDVAATEKALYHTFLYRGLFTKDGSWDRKVYKDDNASTLSRNYAAAHMELAIHYRRTGQVAKAVAEGEQIERMFPDYAQLLVVLGSFYMDQGDTSRALALFDRLAQRSPDSPEARYYHGAGLAYRGHTDAALAEMDAAIRLDPDYWTAYYGAFTTLMEAGRSDRALPYLERWLNRHPDDRQAQAVLESARRYLAPESSSGAPPPAVRLP